MKSYTKKLFDFLFKNGEDDDCNDTTSKVVYEIKSYLLFIIQDFCCVCNRY